MEKEIAGKILLCLRNPSKHGDETASLHDNSNNSPKNTVNENISNVNIIFPNENISSCTGFSFSQYIAQSVDGVKHTVNVDDYDENNQHVLKTRRTSFDESNNLWNKFCTCLEEYSPLDGNIKDTLSEFKSEVAGFTGINEDLRLETAALIILNLYLKEKASANRKEELQRIFTIMDFRNIHKISNGVNEVLKFLSAKQLDDFKVRWSEVFEDRIEELEQFFCNKAMVKKNSEHFTESANRDKLPIPKWINVRKSKTLKKLRLLNQIVSIQNLADTNREFSAKIAERNVANSRLDHCRDMSQDSHSDERIIEIDISLSDKRSAGSSVGKRNIFNKEIGTKLICKVGSSFLFREFNRKEAEKILISQLKGLVKEESLESKRNIQNKVSNIETLSCQKLNYFGSDFKEIDPRSTNNVFGKCWIEKQLKNCLSRSVIESVNTKLLVLCIIDFMNSSLTAEELEQEFIDAFSIRNICLIRTLLSHRESINEHCKLIHQKKGVRNLARSELLTLKNLILQEESNTKNKELSLTMSGVAKSSIEYNKMTSSYRFPPKKIECPHIYDSNVEAKLSSSFVSGTKILLPECHSRKDTRIYEEVTIPISLFPSSPVKYDPVYISSLDKIGQTVFSNIEKLNIIQSIVFSTAYNSNENLLICAPTGAGKTNVALLTVVHEIKQNFENGVLRKDKFKIIYIAPMKALAAEMTRNFSSRLKDLNVVVKELTGDMQLSKSEIASTQILVTTPEKWDLVTRKGDGDTTLSGLVKLLIIDEVHLLHSDRGPVIEALVARTLRQVETSQKMIRIVGLSATLPNYKDVAAFLRVNLQTGLFYFDSRFRPVPLSQCFVGIKARKSAQQMMEMNQVCYDKVFDHIKNGMQVMVFVHMRNATMRTGLALKEMAQQKGHLSFFELNEEKNSLAKKLFERAKAKQLNDLLPHGFGIHHAGLLRYDRNLVEDCFAKGYIKVLVCTSTLAWGVNLPAHAVIIKGTEIYDSKHGSFIDLGILDVLQIFGRAGRPQFNESGHGVIITTHNKLHQYLSLMMNQFPIESRFISYLADNLNAEITLGTITCIEEAVEWLSYTYLFVRMRINPQEYGINYADVEEEILGKRLPGALQLQHFEILYSADDQEIVAKNKITLEKFWIIFCEKDNVLCDKRRELIEHAAKILDQLLMIRYNEQLGKLSPTDLGRTASLFYIKYNTIETFNGLLQNVMNEPETLNMLSQAQEFDQLKVRDDEVDELDLLQHEYCEYSPAGGSENIHGKVNILLQTFLSRGRVKSFSLISDLAYVSQNASRIMRGLFDIVLKKNNPILAGRFLQISQMLEHQQWFFETPLRQFTSIPEDIITKIEKRDVSIEQLKEMDSKEIGIFLRNAKMGGHIKKCVEEFPRLFLKAIIQPITRAVLRIRLNVKADFIWNDKIHGRTAEPFWIWVEDPDTNFMYHSEYFFMTRKQVMKDEVQELTFTIPVHEPLPSQYVIRIPSDRWLGAVSLISVSLHDVILPELHPVQTDLLPLQPLPVSALQCPEFESLYKFSHFNPIQTQIFHCLYYTDNNVLLGAPTGSGKTIVAEIAILRVFKEDPTAKVVYIAPLKALVKERIRDWKVRFQKKMKKEVVELTGDVTPDIQAISSASIIVTTPEKWDSISRSWQTRNYVKKVVLIVIDEIHLLGEDRGPVLEVIVSRTNFIVSHTQRHIRIVGLSTALANAQDLANWLRINETGMYNFRPSVRPVPLEAHISAFPGKYYCPRMASMNKPAFQAIKQYSPIQPVLIFVSSRRQTRLTAMDLLAQLASENNPKQWLKLKDSKINKILDTVKDDNLKVMLAFGIGLHHAGLQESDRKIVEELFEHQQIQVLIATSTLAWGVNFPAHLVIIKGTEYYDCKTHRYVDMPITDILQMMGRAGRPQFDKQGVAVIMVHDVKKNFYKKFLYEPFPVESNLLAVLPDHLNAEIVAGTIRSCQDALDYLTWTYFFRRLLQNPAFYGITSLKDEEINSHLTNLISAAVITLERSQCLIIDEDGRTLHPTTLGRICSYYYISHQTMLHFKTTLHPEMTIEGLLDVLSHAHEYNEIPVRHNEEITNSELAKFCKIQVDASSYDSPHTKTHLLLQAHFSRLVLPCTDYQTDLKSVLDQAVRILQAMIDVCGERGWLISTLRAQQLLQMLIQGRWITDHPILTLPGIDQRHLYLFMKNSDRPLSLPTLVKVVYKKYGELLNLLHEEFTETLINKIYEVLLNLPKVQVELSISESIKENKFDENQDLTVTTVKLDTQFPVSVKMNREYVLQMKLTQLTKRADAKVYAPKFSKPKDESWFLNFGVIENRELLALKRFTFGRRKEVFHNFVYQVPNRIGPAIITVYLMSDSYIGLDQQFNVPLNIVP